jgi:cyclophilin family peptidyl-prolyl cis-trans isomerase/protein-disulfide isomerase
LSHAVCGEIQSRRSSKAGKIENLYQPGRFLHFMSKSTLFVMLLTALFASACQGAGSVSTTEQADRTLTHQTETPAPANMAPPTAAATLPSAEELSAAQCTVVSSLSATPEESPYPSVGEGDWSRGPATAVVTIIEYSDFQCPGCAAVAPVLAQLQEDYPDQVRIAYRHFPLLSIHDKAALATQAAEAAGVQGSFWEMHDLLFERQGEWVSLSSEEFHEWLIAAAGELELDVDRFAADLISEDAAALAQDAWDAGVAAELPGTPFLLINGRPYGGPRDFYSLEAILKTIQLEERQFTECPPLTIDPTQQYIATLKTEKGDIVLELFPDVAPLAVNSFVFLARHGWFDNITFHRVLPGFVAQAGDPSGTGMGSPGYAFDNEISPDLKFDRAGVLGMANAGPGSNGSQFFITLGPAPQLDGGYTIFGSVVEGMDVLESLTPRNPQEDPTLPPGDVILTVTIEEN